MSKMHSRTSFTGPSFFLASTSKAGSTISMTSLNCVRSEVIEVERALREEFHLICPREHHHHFKGSVGLTTFGGKKLEPIPEALFKFFGCFHTSISSIGEGAYRTPHEHKHGWSLINACSCVWEHTIMECMEFLLACHVPQRQSNPIFGDGPDFNSLCAILQDMQIGQEPSQLMSLSCMDGMHGG